MRQTSLRGSFALEEDVTVTVCDVSRLSYPALNLRGRIGEMISRRC
jgi:hypothetical protein